MMSRRVADWTGRLIERMEEHRLLDAEGRVAALMAGVVGVVFALVIGVVAVADAGNRSRTATPDPSSCWATGRSIEQAQRAFAEGCAGRPQVDCDRGATDWVCSDAQVAVSRSLETDPAKAGKDRRAQAATPGGATSRGQGREATTGGGSGGAEAGGPSPVLEVEADRPTRPAPTGGADDTTDVIDTIDNTTGPDTIDRDRDDDADDAVERADASSADAPAASPTSARPVTPSASQPIASTTVSTSGAARPTAPTPTPTTAASTTTTAATIEVTAAPVGPTTVVRPVGDPPERDRRDPLDQPFRWDSPWNMPIGSGARYIDAGIGAPQNGPGVDEDIIILTPDAPTTRVNRTSIGWSREMTRCEGRLDGSFQFGGDALPIPRDFTTENGAYHGLTPNHAGAVLDADGRTIRQSQPFHVCGPGVAVTRADYPDDDIRTGDGIRGAHGGSGMSSLGGAIRLYDIEQGRIAHALKLTIDASQYLSRSNGGYRWPAVKADGYVNAPTSEKCHYGGSIAEVRMGALLALRPGFDTGSMRTELGRMLAEAFVGYGGYVVDDACWDKFQFATEWGPAGRVTDQVKRRHGIDMQNSERPDCTSSTPNCLFALDVADIVEALHVVDNNGPAAPGGPGRRLAACAPAFTDGTGGAPPGSVCD